MKWFLSCHSILNLLRIIRAMLLHRKKKTVSSKQTHFSFSSFLSSNAILLGRSFSTIQFKMAAPLPPTHIRRRAHPRTHAPMHAPSLYHNTRRHHFIYLFIDLVPVSPACSVSLMRTRTLFFMPHPQCLEQHLASGRRSKRMYRSHHYLMLQRSF